VLTDRREQQGQQTEQEQYARPSEGQAIRPRHRSYLYVVFSRTTQTSNSRLDLTATTVYFENAIARSNLITSCFVVPAKAPILHQRNNPTKGPTKSFPMSTTYDNTPLIFDKLNPKTRGYLSHSIQAHSKAKESDNMSDEQT